MTQTLNRPWEALPPAVAGVLRPELPALADEIIAAVREGVPEYSGAIEGRFGAGLRAGVEEALRQFVAVIERPSGERGAGREVYVQLGRGEQRAGRPLDALLGAYRLGARVAWRRLATAGRAAGLAPETLYLLAESIFAYIDELSAESAEGYADEQLAAAGEASRRRRRLADLLVRDPPADPSTVETAAREARWDLPRSLAAVALAGEGGDPLAPRLPVDALVTRVGELVCALVPDPDGPGRGTQLERALEGREAVLGPTLGWVDAGRSFARAAAALLLVEDGVLPRGRLLSADDHAATLLLHGDRGLARDFAHARLAPLAGLPPKVRARLAATLLAWLAHQGRLRAAADALGVHPQTVRYRLARLREHLGSALDDPEGRFELELALRLEAAPGG